MDDSDSYNEKLGANKFRLKADCKSKVKFEVYGISVDVNGRLFYVGFFVWKCIFLPCDVRRSPYTLTKRNVKFIPCSKEFFGPLF